MFDWIPPCELFTIFPGIAAQQYRQQYVSKYKDTFRQGDAPFRITSKRMAGELGPSGTSARLETYLTDLRLISRMFDELRLPIFLIDSGATVLYGNRMANDLFGGGTAELAGLHLLQSLSSEDQDRLLGSLKDVVAGVPVLLRLEHFKALDFTITPLYDDCPVTATHFILCASRERLCEPGTLNGFARRYLLTRSERDILDLVVGGHSAEQIAAHRGVSEATVRTHLKNTLHKTGHRTLRQLQARIGKLPPV